MATFKQIFLDCQHILEHAARTGNCGRAFRFGGVRHPCFLLRQTLC